MNKKITLLKNVTFVNEGATRLRDILIKDNKIEKIDNVISADNKYNILDMSDLLVIPGVIDDQVHFREPGAIEKATIYTESRAAVLGGTTSFMDMPNNNPPCTDKNTLQQKNSIAAKDSLANYSFYLGATNDNLEEIKSIDPTKTCGVKIFMGSSTGNLLVDNEKALEEIFTSSPVIITTHCEDNKIISENLQKFKDKYNNELNATMHPLIRSSEACITSTKKAIELAKKNNANLHVLHITTKEEVELFKEFAHLPITERKITAEVCAHHLFFNSTYYETLGNKIKCNPAIKDESDRKALISGLNSAIITNIATDHAPHTYDEKMQPYEKSPSGLPLIQFSLIALLELVHKGELPLERVVDMLCHNVAKRFNIKERGFIKEGYFADLVAIKKQDHQIMPRDIISKCAWSPFTGMTFSNKIYHTFVNGNHVVKEGKLIENSPSGQMLLFDR